MSEKTKAPDTIELEVDDRVTISRVGQAFFIEDSLEMIIGFDKLMTVLEPRLRIGDPIAEKAKRTRLSDDEIRQKVINRFKRNGAVFCAADVLREGVSVGKERAKKILLAMQVDGTIVEAEKPGYYVFHQ